MNLLNQVVLVTGASGGIGSAICRALAAEGASVVLHYHSRREQCLALEQELKSTQRQPGQDFCSIQANLLEETSAIQLIAAAVSRFSRLDLLVNNAGWSKAIPADQLKQLDEQVLTNTLGLKIHAPLYLVRAAEPFLKSSPTGQIINITSVAGIAARGSSIVYAAANAALSSLTKSLARSLAPAVRVNAVAPGFVETGFVWPADGSVKANVSRNNHIGRAVEADEVAKVVRFLACSAPSITGEEIVIDGGIGRLGKKDHPRL